MLERSLKRRRRVGAIEDEVLSPQKSGCFMELHGVRGGGKGEEVAFACVQMWILVRGGLTSSIKMCIPSNHS